LLGNLDTLSELNLLTTYEKIKEKYALDSVFIDSSNIEYVSSKGLRVLLIMQNDCEGGVIMNSSNENVIEILSETNIIIK